MIKIVSPKGFLTQEQFDLVKITIAKIEDLMCDFALSQGVDRNGMASLALSITHLAISPMIEVERDMVEVFFDGLLAGDMPEIHDVEQCIREDISPENLN